MFKQRLETDSLVGGWVSLGDSAVPEMLAPMYDFLMLDTEHAPNSTETIAQQARAIDAAPGETATLARPLGNSTGAIKRLLDLGVDGVMVPMVGSAAEANAAVDAVRYPPEGSRGIAGTRASNYGRDLGEYVATANEETTLIVQVETSAGLDNVEEIATTEGVDALFVGPADLSANLGVFGEFDGDEFREAVETILAAADDAGVPVGTLATTREGVERYGSWGYDYLIAGTDAGGLQREASVMSSLAAESLD